MPSTPGDQMSDRPQPVLAYLPGENPALFDLPEGCKEQAHIRLAYLGAISSSVVDKSTRETVEFNLSVSLDGYRLAGVLPAHPKPVTTLASVRRRLGLDIDAYMTQKPLCSKCYRLFSFDEIRTSETPHCSRAGCSGSFWQLSGDDIARKPTRVAAYGGVVAALRRMFMRPEFALLLKAGDEVHASHSDQNVLHDVCDGSAWKAAEFGLTRIYENGVVSDIPSPPPVVSLGFGLAASVNIDWFRVSKSTSVGGVYLSILNLHRSVRNLPWNVLLACTMPGPGEPSLEDLNNILEPIVEEFKVLYAGKLSWE